MQPSCVKARLIAEVHMPDSLCQVAIHLLPHAFGQTGSFVHVPQSATNYILHHHCVAVLLLLQ